MKLNRTDKAIHKRFNEIRALMLKKAPVLKKLKLKKGQRVPVEILIQDALTDEVLGSVKTFFTKEELLRK